MMSKEQYLRYGRHLIMPEVGPAGQEKINAAKILMVGAGGLGSPSALYLAASGVGQMTIIDPDVVDLSNLQRQILHDTSSVGEPKVESAKRRINEVNPNVKVNAIQDQLSNDNVRQLVREHDIVVDGTDNFQTRYMVNDACIFEGKLNVYGSIFRFDGQSTVLLRARWPLLSLPLSRTAAARHGAELRRRWRLRHSARRGWRNSGDRSHQADYGQRPTTYWASDAL